MRLSDVFNAQAVAANFTEAASNDIPYLGAGLFPSKKKAGLTLKWIKGHNGLPVMLAPSSLDTKSTFRGRQGISINETEMAYFKEGMLVKEEDYQEILRVQDSNDEYAQDVLDRIFDDTTNLVRGADVIPEIMRMSLLAPIGGVVGITMPKENGTNYTYNYDPNGEWKSEHYLKIETDTDKWTAADTCNPIKNIEDALDAQEAAGGNRPELALMSKETFNLIKASKAVKDGVLAQNLTPHVNYTSARVKLYIEEELKITLIVYNKKYKDAEGKTQNFYPDNIVMLLPNGAVGNTYYGTTPTEARAKLSKGEGDDNFAIVNTGVTVKTVERDDPENTETIVSEMLLPSFERIDECYAIEVA